MLSSVSFDAEPPLLGRRFPVKVLKLFLHELQTNGEAAIIAYAQC